MSHGNAYGRQARECLLMALGAKTEGQKASWLQLADAWLKLAGWKDRREAEDAQYAHPEFMSEFHQIAPNP